MLSSTAGSFLITLCGACGVPTGESDLVTVSCCSSQRAVLRGLVVHSMSLLVAVPISPDAFRDFFQAIAHMCTATISRFLAFGSGMLRHGNYVGPSQ